MRNLRLAIVLLGGLCAAGTVVAQQAAVKIEPQPLPDTSPLAITVNTVPSAQGQLPQFVTITLTNTSDRSVRMPQPSIGCDDRKAGSVVLVVSPSGRRDDDLGCGHVDGLAWIVIPPGDSANFGQMVNPLLPQVAGTFELRGVFTPADLSAAKREELYRDSVLYPTEKLTSEPVTLVRETP